MGGIAGAAEGGTEGGAGGDFRIEFGKYLL